MVQCQCKSINVTEGRRLQVNTRRKEDKMSMTLGSAKLLTHSILYCSDDLAQLLPCLNRGGRRYIFESGRGAGGRLLHMSSVCEHTTAWGIWEHAPPGNVSKSDALRLLLRHNHGSDSPACVHNDYNYLSVPSNSKLQQ